MTHPSTCSGNIGWGFNAASVLQNAGEADLVQRTILAGEGDLGIGGALLVNTGQHTGRSPKDKFIVARSSIIDDIWTDENQTMCPKSFQRLSSDFRDYIVDKGMYSQDLFTGSLESNRASVRVVTELAWHSLFIRHMLRHPRREELETFEPEYLIVDCPGFKADPEVHGCRSSTVVALDLERRLVLIGGTAYAGEIKKSVFTILNYLLPLKGMVSMHCSANHAKLNPSDSAIFFGLSGTGKTTLSSDRGRTLVGDDEHVWCDEGIFNIEGGCYAKTIDLDPEAEPDIYATTGMFGTVVENMVYDPATRELDFSDASITQNTRCAYPLHYIPGASSTGTAGQPKNVFMLTCDVFGVLPPIARLSQAQAAYHFLSGFTSKIGGTEQGVVKPQPVFSSCFGKPFLPLAPEVYGRLFRERIAGSDANCWLVNTGWTGGGIGEGSRMPIKFTRLLLEAAMDGKLNQVEYGKDPNFGFGIPESVVGVPREILDPKRTWGDRNAYMDTARKVATMFARNFDGLAASVDDEVRAAAIGVN